MITRTTTFSGGRIFDGERLLDGFAVVVENGRIVRLVESAGVHPGNTISFAGYLLVPGFVDLQVNGGGGLLFNDCPTVEGLAHIFEAHRKFGTTAMLPTLISDDFLVMQHAAQSIRQALAGGQRGIVGMHFEGPFLNRTRRGVHPALALRAPDLRTLELMTAKGLGRVMVTLAPEIVPPGCVQALAAAGVMVSIGHTASDYTTAKGALADGAKCFTHLFNAMTPLCSREPGVVGAALEHPTSFCGIIVDGHHVHPATLRLALAAKKRGRIFLVTDAMPCVGSSLKSFSLFGEQVSVMSGRCSTAQGTLAGSDLDMAAAVRNSVELLGLSLEESLRMASLYPANLLGDTSRGRIATGYRADFCLLNEELRVGATCVAGQFETS